MMVTIQVDLGKWKRGKGHVPDWKHGWSAEVLFADRKKILLRSLGSHQCFYGAKPPKVRRAHPRYATVIRSEALRPGSWGWMPGSRAGKALIARLGLKTDGWGRTNMPNIRMSPKSFARLVVLVAERVVVAKAGKKPVWKLRKRSPRKV